ncbi:MAG: PolC-type DNA polymerase III [Firmicutes bacterium]|nr:PolC-type DNA polymerase III [Bacillota bacterium]
MAAGAPGACCGRRAVRGAGVVLAQEGLETSRAARRTDTAWDRLCALLGEEGEAANLPPARVERVRVRLEQRLWVVEISAPQWPAELRSRWCRRAQEVALPVQGYRLQLSFLPDTPVSAAGEEDPGRTGGEPDSSGSAFDAGSTKADGDRRSPDGGTRDPGRDESVDYFAAILSQAALPQAAAPGEEGGSAKGLSARGGAVRQGRADAVARGSGSGRRRRAGRPEDGIREPDVEKEEREGKHLLLGRRFQGEPVPLAKLESDGQRVVVAGEILTREVRNLRSGRKLLIFDLYDGTDSLTVKAFLPEEGDISWATELPPGQWVRVRGSTQMDPYSHELNLLAQDIVTWPAPPGRQDQAPEKRVELHLHTKMSAMDATTDAEAAIKLAARFGHPAVAVTDHGVVQAFPEAYAAAKKAGIKLIYGLEGYLIEKDEAPKPQALPAPAATAGPEAGWEAVGNAAPRDLDSLDRLEEDDDAPAGYDAAGADLPDSALRAPGTAAEGGEKQGEVWHIILLARNQTGLRNLYKLVSEAHLHHFYRHPRLPRAVIQEHREGLLVGTACEAGELFQAVLAGASEGELARIASFYDYLEIQPVANNEFLLRSGRVRSREELQALNRRIYQLGRRLGKPVVATGDVHFLHPEDAILREILLAGQGYSDAGHQPPVYFHTTQEMLEEFAYLGPEAAYEVVVKNPQAIAAQVEEFPPLPQELFAPEIPGAEEEVRRLTEERARQLYGDPLPDLVRKRLDRELQAIIGHGFAVLYLIAQKLVKKSLDDGYLVGARGSVGSSLVATMCGITDVNPLPPHYRCPHCHYVEFVPEGTAGCGPDLPSKDCPRCGKPLVKDGFNIPFETFLGFEGDKVPDIDLNFSGEYQAQVHRYTEELFGHDHVFRAGTISTLAERTAYGFVRKYLDSQGRQARTAEINRLARGLTGVKRTTGQHPGGMMVVPRSLDIHQFTPVQHPANDASTGIITTHFDYKAISSRLVKLDILGHDDPTVVRMLSDLTGIDARQVPLDDPATLSLFSSTEALGVTPEEIGTSVGVIGIPEFGTPFVRKMLEQTRPHTFSELLRISGFSHGTDVWLNNAQDLIASGVATLNEAIATRDDIMLYLLQRNLPPKAAFKIMEQVRKAKGLKPEDEALMKEHGVPDWYIQSCRKISYLFPKAHAVAYVTMAFRIAYFKVHYPLAFYASYFSVRAEEFDADLVCRGRDAIRQAMAACEAKGNDATQKEKNLATILEVALEAMARGIRFLPVSVYKSADRKFAIEGKALRPPLAALQGLGEAAARQIVAARQERPFSSVEDFRQRTHVNRTVLELLRQHGALGDLPETDQMALF